MSIETLTARILEKMSKLNLCRQKFMRHLLVLLCAYRGKHNFTNLSRNGLMHEHTYRMSYGKDFDFFEFNQYLLSLLPHEKRILAFDPSYISKSGKHTDGVGKYWSGCAGKSKHGLDLSGFAAVGLSTKTAFHLKALQTLPKKGKRLHELYMAHLDSHKEKLLEISDTIIVDAYFFNKDYVNKVTSCGFKLISRMQSNANPRYLYDSQRTGKQGRPREFDGQVDYKNLDKKYFKCFYEDEKEVCYEAKLNSKCLKKEVKAVIVEKKKKDENQQKGKKEKGYFILYSTDTEMYGMDILTQYRLRFQIEFLYRDAKQHTGLDDCQARTTKKLEHHRNASLTAVSFAKAIHLLDPKTKDEPSSMYSVKVKQFNENFLNRVFTHFGLDLEKYKHTDKYAKFLEFGIIAA